MKNLDLTNLENSDIKYKISKFPDGQQAITIDLENTAFETGEQVVTIKSRLNSFLDLELIICANQALIELGANVIPAIIQGLNEESIEEPNLCKGADCLTDLLVKFGTPSVQPLIAQLGKSRHAYLALGRIGAEEAVQALVRELTSCNWRRVELACTALGLVEHPGALKTVAQLDALRKSTRSGEVYTAAGEAINAIQNRFHT